MTTLKYFTAGHSAMVLCCLLYATWWYIAFRPDAEGGLLIGRNGLIFGLTFISGLIGVMLIVLGIRNAPESTWLSVRTICILGVLSCLAGCNGIFLSSSCHIGTAVNGSLGYNGDSSNLHDI